MTSQIHNDASAMTTASFYTDTRQHPPQPSSKKPTSYVYCKQQHSPSSCNTVTNPQDRLAIVKKNNLCFNCLAHHKVIQCTSKYRCRKCKRKHHTSLCTGPAQPTTLSETPDSSKKDTNESNKTVVTLTPATQKSSVNQPPKQAGACLLKTAIAAVS